jgi:ferredoxin
MPEARSVISMAFRVMRGSLRGIEEGTFFSNYSAMGYGGITYLYMPMTVINLAKRIEDAGYEAIPYGHQSDWRSIDNVGNRKPDFSRPVAPGRAAPDVMVHQRIAAYLCGLGEIGWSKMFLTKRFGPRQRVGIVITEAELEPDPLMEPGTLCNRCMACVEACPSNAIPRDRSVKVTLAGKQVEWADIDCEACDIAFRGALLDDDVPDEDSYTRFYGHNTRPGWWSPFIKKPRNLYNTGQAVCGARGCTRACMIAMEKRGILDNKFHEKFRRRPEWSVDWSKPSPEEEDAGQDAEAVCSEAD